jgi:hypothetical protein
MHTKEITISIILFVVLCAGMFIYAYLKSKEVAEIPQIPQDEETADPYAHITRIDAKHFFTDTPHTIAGEIALPTPCDLVDHDVFVRESYPEQVQIDFKIVNEADVCAAVVTTQRFKVVFEASKDARISARLNGRDVELNLIPASPGESPDDFELFIKG